MISNAQPIQSHPRAARGAAWSTAWRWLVVTAFAVLALLAPRDAQAGGSVQWSSTFYDEKDPGDDGYWKLKMIIRLSQRPTLAVMPIQLAFTQTEYWEQAIVDGDKTIERHVPVTGKPPIFAPMEASFLDPSTGKTEMGASFDFKLKRDVGFEAGVYQVVVRDKATNQTLGQPTRLTLRGKNKAVDRRAMVFKKAEKKDDKDEKKKDDKSVEEKEREREQKRAEDEKTWPDEGKKGHYTSIEEEERIKGRPKGCGCSLESPSGGVTPWLVVIGLSAMFAFRRRRT